MLCFNSKENQLELDENSPTILLPSSYTVRQRYSRGVIILRHGQDIKRGKCELVITTPGNRNGQVFTITKRSVRQIHSANMRGGSVTIEMIYPSVLICIKEASFPLLHECISRMHRVLAGLEVTLGEDNSVTWKTFFPFRRRLILATRKQYNENKLGFPPYLQEIIMSNIGLSAVDSRWFGATSLRTLDLSGNRLGKSDLFETRFLNIVRLQHLKVLVLADNEIQSISDDLWNALPQNLLSLDLSSNHISYLSPCCMRFPEMTHLLLGHNRIEELPRTVNNLTKLKHLDISWNRLKFLPSEVRNLSLEVIDVSAYNGDEAIKIQDVLQQLLQKTRPTCMVGTLFEYAAAAVLNYKISMNSLPKPLVVMIGRAVENCKSGGTFRFYPASIVTAKYQIEDARSLALQAVARTHYDVILRDMAAI